MEQEKNKVPSQENENPGLEKFQRAQELYERYFISNEEADFEEMITVLDSIYKNRVKSELREKGCCDKENYEDAMQEARQGIWTRIKKQRETGELHKEFSQYCGGIYTYKAVDIAKKKNSYEQKMREVKKKGKKGKEDQKSYMEVVYLDANLPDSDGTYGELAADPNKKNRAESEVFAEESRNIFGIYLQKYCQAMTNAKAEPPRALALYYARILPHVLYIMYGIETIPDSKGASAAWAFEHMQEKTMEILGEQSEEEMQDWLYDSLRWSENFWNQMDLEIYVNSERKLLKDVVYTEVYDQRRIDDWSESMHKTVTELAHREIKKDKRLANWAVDHIVESDKTYNLFKGGRKK